MNELYRDNSVEALNFYSKALRSGGCMNCGHCPVNEELRRLRGYGLMEEKHPILRRPRHQRLMRGGVDIVEVDDLGREIGSKFSSLIPASSGAVSTYVNKVGSTVDYSGVITPLVVSGVLALKGLYDSYKKARATNALPIEEKKEVILQLEHQIKKEGDKVIKEVAKASARKPRKPRAVKPKKPRAKASKKKCRMVKVRQCNY
jgi:hypothetical protein